MIFFMVAILLACMARAHSRMTAVSTLLLSTKRPSLTARAGTSTRLMGSERPDCSHFEFDLRKEEWEADAQLHATEMENMMYPPLESRALDGQDPSEQPLMNTNTLRERRHAVNSHPIYNFLHTYYRYSSEELLLYSPGIGVGLKDVMHDNIKPLRTSNGKQKRKKKNSTGMKELLHPLIHLSDSENNKSDASYNPQKLIHPLQPSGRYGWTTMSRNRDILAKSSLKQPNFACYGLHEWAMLYKNYPPHQKNLSLRVSQDTIDELVGIPGSLKCTHFDAYRFFHPKAQELNVLHPLTRDSQLEKEQPGCIHATMDLFKFAYTLYPFVSSRLLRDTLQLGIKARRIDMRASPYDVHEYQGCEHALCVETAEGRAEYAREQEELYEEAVGLRERLIKAYDRALAIKN